MPYVGRARAWCGRIPVIVAVLWIAAGPVAAVVSDAVSSGRTATYEVYCDPSGASDTCPNSCPYLLLVAQVTQINPDPELATITYRPVIGSLLGDPTAGTVAIPSDRSLVLVLGGTTVTYTSGTTVRPTFVTQAMVTAGSKHSYSYYPFDSYLTIITAGASLQNGSTQTPIPLCLEAAVSLTNFVATQTRGSGTYPTVNSGSAHAVLSLQFSRSVVVQFASMLIVVLMWCVSGFIFGLALDHVFFRPREPAGPTVGFFISTIFSFPAIRNTQPGVPPIGAMVDMFGFFWNMILLVLAALLMLSAFVGYHRYPGHQEFKYV